MPASAKEALKYGPPLSPKLREQIVNAMHNAAPSTYTLHSGKLAPNGHGGTSGSAALVTYLSSVIIPGRLHCICRPLGAQPNSAIITLPTSS